MNASAKRCRLTWLLCAWLAGTGTVAGAAPRFRVRDRAEIRIGPVARTDSGVRIRGRLLAIAGGVGVANEFLRVRVAGQEFNVSTDELGQFDFTVSLGLGEHRLSASFLGSTSLDPIRLLGYRFEVGKEPLGLVLDVDRNVPSDASGLEVRLRARSNGAPARVTANLSIEEIGQQTTRSVGTLITSARGRGRLIISREKLGRPGEKRIVARFAGSDSLSRAEDDARFRVTTTSKIVDVSLPDEVPFEDQIIGRGRLVEFDGAPVASAAITMRVASGESGVGSTDKNGAFAIAIDADELLPGQVMVSLEFRSLQNFRKSARSAPRPVTILAPRPVPIGYLLFGAGCAALALLAFALGRARPWEPLVRAWQRRKRRRKATSSDSAVISDRTPQGGVWLARPGLISTLRRPNDVGISGHVRDVRRHTTIADAIIHLRRHGPAEMKTTHTDQRGEFAVEALVAASWQVEIIAHGYVTQRVDITVPHRGELRGIMVDLLPVRDQLWAVYRQAAQHMLPRAELWGVWTPREIFEHMRKQRPAGALGDMTDLVEEATFSARVPGEGILPVVAQHAQAVRQLGQPS